MYSKIFVLLFALVAINSIDGGSIKYAQLMLQPASVQQLVNDLLFENDRIDSQFDLVSWRVKTAVATAKINTKLTLKQMQAVIKANKGDLTCGPAAQFNAKLIERELDTLKTCQLKDELKMPKNQIVTYLKSLTVQAYSIGDFCQLVHTTAEEIDGCTDVAVNSIRAQLNEVKALAEDTVEAVGKKGEDCVNERVQIFEAGVAKVYSDLDNCQNPTEAPVVVNDESKPSKESAESEPSKESNESEPSKESNESEPSKESNESKPSNENANTQSGEEQAQENGEEQGQENVEEQGNEEEQAQENGEEQAQENVEEQGQENGEAPAEEVQEGNQGVENGGEASAEENEGNAVEENEQPQENAPAEETVQGNSTEQQENGNAEEETGNVEGDNQEQEVNNQDDENKSAPAQEENESDKQEQEQENGNVEVNEAEKEQETEQYEEHVISEKEGEVEEAQPSSNGEEAKTEVAQ